jgi:hypothetical protein
MARLGALGGRVIGLGTRPEDTFTILHVAEEMHAATRAWAFEDAPRVMTIVDGAVRFAYRFQVLRPDPARDRFEHGLLRTLVREGVVTAVVERGLPCVIARADRLLARALELIAGADGQHDGRAEYVR